MNSPSEYPAYDIMDIKVETVKKLGEICEYCGLPIDPTRKTCNGACDQDRLDEEEAMDTYQL